MPPALSGLWIGLCLTTLLLVPGAAALRLGGDPSRGALRLARGLGLSMALWPLGLLWSSLLGLRWSAPVLWLALAACALVAWPLPRRAGHPAAWRASARGGRPVFDSAAIALGIVLLLALVTRWLQARGLVVPPWVDGFHHSLVTQLILDAGRIPESYRPYLDVAPFYYHFGFHSLAAVATWISGQAPWTVVLALGQALNAATALTAYALARGFGLRRLPAVLSAALPATLFYLPAYFLSWGRYTQLSGLVLLPIAWLLLLDATRSRDPRRYLLSALANAGLLLLHYRVMAFFVVGALLIAFDQLRWPGRAAARLAPRLGRVSDLESGDAGLASGPPPPARLLTPASKPGQWRFCIVSAASLLLASPWLLRNMRGGWESLSAASPEWVVGTAEIAARVAEAPPDWLFTWGSNGFWIRLACLGLLAGLLAGRRAAWALAAGLLACFLMVAPQRLGLPSSWLLPPFSLAISLYLPVALGLGMLGENLAQAWRALARAPADRTATPARLLARAPGMLGLLSLLASGLVAWQRRDIVSPLDDGSVALTLYLGAAFLLSIPAGRALRQAARKRSAGPEHQRPAQAEILPGETPPGAGLAQGARGRPAERLAAAALVLLALAGAREMTEIVRDDTVIAVQADIEAAVWLEGHSPEDALVLVNTTHWHLGTWRGLDGGYWLPLLANRRTSMPAALYTHGRPEQVLEIGALAEAVSAGEKLDDAALSDLLDRAGASWVYVGPASEGHPDAFSADRLRAHPELVERYARSGAHVFERVVPGP